MSSISYSTPRPKSIGFALLLIKFLEWLHHRTEQRQLVDELEALSDRDLCDIGVLRADIGKRVDAEISAIGLRSLR